MLKKYNISIVKETDDILVLDKPSGILTIPDRYDHKAINLRSILMELYKKIFIVHRLDKDTSGLVLFAKTAEAHRHLSLQFQEQTVKRIYHAVLQGVLREERMEIDISLMPDSAIKGRTIPSARGKESLTLLEVKEKFRSSTLVELQLKTGRRHQIRAHCAAIGFPLLVDSEYGQNSEFLLSSIKRRYNIKKGEVERPIISRLTMHAHKLEFINPSNLELESYCSEYPKDFNSLVKLLRKYSSIRKYV